MSKNDKKITISPNTLPPINNRQLSQFENKGQNNSNNVQKEKNINKK